MYVLRPKSILILTIHHIILTIRKSIVRKLCSGCAEIIHIIRIKESAGFRVIITALEIIESGFAVIVIAAVTDGNLIGKAIARQGVAAVVGC